MVHNLHSIINSVEGIVKLTFSDDQRRSDVKNRSAYPHEDSVFKQLLLEGNNRSRVRILELRLNELSISAN
jgi:hypothetical protein